MNLSVRGAVTVRSPRGELRVDGAGDRLELRLPAAPGRAGGLRRWKQWASWWLFLRRHPKRVADLAAALRRTGLHADVLFTERSGVRVGGSGASPGWIARLLGLAPLQLAPIPRTCRPVRTGRHPFRRPTR